jgi:hypothetical protein
MLLRHVQCVVKLCQQLWLGQLEPEALALETERCETWVSHLRPRQYHDIIQAVHMLSSNTAAVARTMIVADRVK